MLKSNFLVNKILFVETISEFYYPYQNWYHPLKKIAKNISHFDYRKNNLFYGKKIMNDLFLEKVKKEKPDFIFFWLIYDEFSLETLKKIKKISPKTKTVVFFGDDDIQFDNFTRYYALFFDYYFVAQPQYIYKYKKDGLRNYFPTLGVNTEIFKPLNLKKIYDCIFIGHPKTPESGRYNNIKYLIRKGINIKIFGWGWNKFLDLKEIYGGPLSNKELVRKINQAKINLVFTKNNYGEPHLIGKVFEGKACGTFTLTEYCKDYLAYFKDKKEIIMFHNQKELLDKVKYYLNHEKEREKIAKAAYKRVKKDYSIKNDLRKFFSFAMKNKGGLFIEKFISLEKRVSVININDLDLGIEKLKIITKTNDYICIKTRDSEFLDYKNVLQAYSLLKSEKRISICDYYVYSKGLGNILAFNTELAYKKLERDKLKRLTHISQILFEKDYFFSNFEKIKSEIKKENIEIKKEDCVFVSIPLIKISRFYNIDYKTIRNAFYMKFLYDIYSLPNKKIKDSFVYIISLLKEILRGKFFILRAIKEVILNKDKWKKLEKIKSSGTDIAKK